MLAQLCLDLTGVVVFAASILGMFFLLYQGHEPMRLTVIMLLTAMLIVRMTSIFSRFFFAPSFCATTSAFYIPCPTARFRIYRTTAATGSS